MDDELKTILGALIQNHVPEKVTRLERIVCALITGYAQSKDFMPAVVVNRALEIERQIIASTDFLKGPPDFKSMFDEPPPKFEFSVERISMSRGMFEDCLLTALRKMSRDRQWILTDEYLKQLNAELCIALQFAVNG